MRGIRTVLPLSVGSLMFVIAQAPLAQSGGRPLPSTQPPDGQPWFAFMVTKEVAEVLDTMGRVEGASFKVLTTSHAAFADALRDAVPRMRFTPAEVRGVKVRQLVQQPFVFALPGQPVPEIPAPDARQYPTPRPGAAQASAPPLGKVKGWSLTQRMTVDSGNGSRRSSTTTFMSAGGVFRHEVLMERAPRMTMVSLIDSATSTTTIIMSQLRTATRMRTLVMPNSDARVIATDTGSLRIDTIPGSEPLLGLPTTRVRSTGLVRVTESLGAVTCTGSRRFMSEAWIVADSTISAIQMLMAKSVAARLGSVPDEPLRALLTRPAPITSVVRTVSGGTLAGVTVTMEVVAYALGELDASLFAIPEGYAVHDMTETPRPPADPIEDVRARSFWQRFDTTRVEPDGSRATCAPTRR